MAEMPKTFRDAIELTQALEFKYLWIDSLCIIQDDAKDWEIESGKMCDVYTNATLTIGAALAAGDREGFLGPRSRAAKSMKNAIPSSQDLVSNLEVREDPAHNRADPLYLRAWVLQERLLSKRMVYFEKHELVWECRNSRTCECEGLDNYKNVSWGSERPIALGHKYLGSSHSDIYGWWKYYVLEEYNRLSLTFDKDRLPALSGLATKVARQTGGTYLAGIWKEDLWLGLLWSSKNASRKSSRTKQRGETDSMATDRPLVTYTAPSWSWASIDDTISHSVRQDPGELPKLQQHMKVLEASCETAGINPTGAVSFGYLKISCPTITATINRQYNPMGELEYRLSFLDETVSLRSDQYKSPWNFEPDTAFEETEYMNWDGKMEKSVRRAAVGNPGVEVDKVKVKIAFITTHLKQEEKRYSRFSLVLGPSDFVDGAWERVALWGYYNDDWKKDYLQNAVIEELVIV